MNAPASTDALTVFWSFRNPYSYLALPRLAAISRTLHMPIDLRVVRPNILRNPHDFKTMHPLARP